MTALENDLRELDWWRTVFATRFMTGKVPRPGDALFGVRFRLINDDTDEPYDREEWMRRA